MEEYSKWKKVNSKTYIIQYSDTCLPSAYYFIENNTIKYILREGNSFDKKYLREGDEIIKFMSQGSFCTGFKDPQKVLIESRFDEVSSILWLKLWNHFPFETTYLKYPIEIGYDIQYGYPKGILVQGGAQEGCIFVDEGKPYYEFFNTIKVMLEKKSTFSEKNIGILLNKLKEMKYKEKNEIHFEQLDIVGGNKVKGFLIKNVSK